MAHPNFYSISIVGKILDLNYFGKNFTKSYPSIRSFLISSTISGFNKVDVSPKLEKSPSAIFRKILRIILPDLVLGNPLTN